MIFVTVGTHDKPFDRLLHSADGFAATTDENVVMQIGGSSFKPKHADQFAFVDQMGMEEWLIRARVIVTHGGAGSVLSALKHGKPLVVVPRRREFGEVLDDHQIELATALDNSGMAVAVMEVNLDAVKNAIKNATLIRVNIDSHSKLINSLKNQLEHWEDLRSVSTTTEHFKDRE